MFLLSSAVALTIGGCSSGSSSDAAQSMLPPTGSPPANQPPTLSGSPPATITQDQAYNFTPSASDPDGDTLTFSITNMPSWAAFSSSSGALTGTPSAQHVGTYTDITISVSDGEDSVALDPFDIEVLQSAPPPGSGNRPPTMSGTPPAAAVQDQQYSFMPSASDPDGDTLTFSITNMPSWANFDTTSGALLGVPTAQDVGTYTAITITVSDGQDSAALGPFDIEVLPAATGSLTLSWTPPTQSADGTALNDLGGYRIRWGTESGVHPNLREVDDPGISRFVIDGLTPGQYYFVVSAVDTSGNEGEPSNEAGGSVQ